MGKYTTVSMPSRQPDKKTRLARNSAIDLNRINENPVGVDMSPINKGQAEQDHDEAMRVWGKKHDRQYASHGLGIPDGELHRYEAIHSIGWIRSPGRPGRSTATLHFSTNSPTDSVQ